MKSLIFFAFIIGIDLFLKSIKDKKKIQEARYKKMQELKNIGNIKTVKQTQTRLEEEFQRKPSLSRSQERDNLFEENKSYIEDYQFDEEKYENLYKDIEKRYEDIRESYKYKKTDMQSQGLYDPNSIEPSAKKEYDVLDVRNYGKSDETIVNLAPKASKNKKDILNGIIFSEILGKPKSLKNK